MFRKPLLLAALCTAVTASAALAQSGQLRYEVEKYTSPGDAWESNHFSANKWNLWSTDKDADKKWSGGVVLQSPVVQKDRASAEEGAPPLHTRITGIPAGTYVVELLHVTRPLAVSLDGKNWQRKDSGDPRLGIFTIRDGVFEVWVDDRYAADPPGSSYYDALLFTPMTPVKNGVSNGDCEANAQRLDGWSFFSRTDSGSCAISTDKHSG
ncbi:MAG TPA: hypothetical protein VHR86_00585, partial [Armatimonadota bacterium]|nr:hypothetical protein [Armatimonadota bacterium]